MSEDFGLPTFHFGVVAIHLEQVAGEEGRFVATGAGADFHDQPRTGCVFAADGHLEELRPQRFALVAQFRHLGLGELSHFRIVAVDHLLRFGHLAIELFELAIFFGELTERTVLAGDGCNARGIGQDLGINKILFELFVAGQFLFE